MPVREILKRAVKKTSILRWSGSKTRLLPDLKRHSPKNYRRYVEPFAGSASLFFELEPRESILGDINPCVMDMYLAIQQDAVGLFETLNGIPKTVESFYTLRSMSPLSLTLVQRAARLIFLMKACFNGVYRTNRLGQFNVPMGDKIYALPSLVDLLAAQSLLQNSILINGEFSVTAEHCREGDWVYLDPPYQTLGRFRGEYGYNAEFCSKNLASFVKTSKRLAEQGCLVTMSYSFDQSFINEFPGWHITPVSAKRSVAGASSKRVLAREIILQNYESFL